MQSSFGGKIKITIFGESHSQKIGADIEGLPTGETVNYDELCKFLARRRPGQSELVSSRIESDIPCIESGIESGIITGDRIRITIKNENSNPDDYENLKGIPRPGHADLGAYLKYGPDYDMTGGGTFSGRLTAPLCVAGGICLQILSRRGIKVSAQLRSVGNVTSGDFDAEIEKAKASGDSVGGQASCTITGVPAGLGGPLYLGTEGDISKAIFAIPGVKGIEFGSGFEGSKSLGSQNNDAIVIKDGIVTCETNNHGGLLGGITTGMPIVFNVAFKPTPSIAKPQRTVNLKTMQETEIEIGGRHDPCIAVRAVPVIEAVAAIVILDKVLGD